MRNRIKFTIKQYLKKRPVYNKYNGSYCKDVTKCVAEITASDIGNIGFGDFTITCEFNKDSNNKENYWFSCDSYTDQIDNATNIDIPIFGSILISNLRYLKDIIKSEFMEQYNNSFLKVDYDHTLTYEETISLKSVLNNRSIPAIYNIDINVVKTINDSVMCNVKFQFDKLIKATTYLQSFTNNSWSIGTNQLKAFGIDIDNCAQGSYHLNKRQKLQIAKIYFDDVVQISAYNQFNKHFSRGLSEFFMDNIELNLDCA